MKLDEIKSAIAAGSRVYWQNSSYEVIFDAKGTDLYIKCAHTGHCIKLVQSDGVTLNGREADFYASNNIDPEG